MLEIHKKKYKEALDFLRIVNSYIDKDACIFGGMPRSIILSEPINDIDIFVCNDLIYTSAIIKIITSEGYKLTDNKSDIPKENLCKRIISFEKDDIIFELCFYRESEDKNRLPSLSQNFIYYDEITGVSYQPSRMFIDSLMEKRNYLFPKTYHPDYVEKMKSRYPEYRIIEGW